VKGKLTWPIFWALIGVFIVVVCLFFIPVFRDLLQGSELFLAPIAVFFLLGVALIFFTVREKVRGIHKKFLLLTGASAVGFFVSILLHNAIYGLFIYWFGADFWDRIGMGDEPFFFLVAIIICPLGFLVGAVGSVVLAIKNKRAKHPT